MSPSPAVDIEQYVYLQLRWELGEEAEAAVAAAAVRSAPQLSPQYVAAFMAALASVTSYEPIGPLRVATGVGAVYGVEVAMLAAATRVAPELTEKARHANHLIALQHRMRKRVDQ